MDMGEDSEARKEWEAANKARIEQQLEELKEYQESRKEAIEAEEEAIRLLREKRVERQKQREEEEKRQAEYRAEEEKKRKAEEAEKRRLKEEEEQRLKDEREQKRKDAEERMKPKGRSFKITKKSDSEKADAKKELDSVMSAEDLQKSKEQLEEEKQAILSQRIQPLSIDGFDSAKLIEKAKELNEQIRRLEGDKYDLEQRFKRQQYDMIELAERSRQMNKGKGQKAVQVDDSFDRLADKYSSAPPKILLCSKYERHTDHRSYVDRMGYFEELAKEPPAPEIQRRGGGGGGGEEEEAEEE